MDTAFQAKPITQQQFYITVGVIYIWMDLLSLEIGAGWWHMIPSGLLLVMALLYIGAGWRARQRPA
jgi:hypothetical protein